jgi:hypothetical protein
MATRVVRSRSTLLAALLGIPTAAQGPDVETHYPSSALEFEPVKIACAPPDVVTVQEVESNLPNSPSSEGSHPQQSTPDLSEAPAEIPRLIDHEQVELAEGILDKKLFFVESMSRTILGPNRVFYDLSQAPTQSLARSEVHNELLSVLQKNAPVPFLVPQLSSLQKAQHAKEILDDKLFLVNTESRTILGPNQVYYTLAQAMHGLATRNRVHN